MKKFLSLVLALIMTMSLVTISAGATEYRDLTDKDEIQYEEAVAVLNRIGVITGYEDGSFRPETELTRGAAAKIIVSLMIGPDAASALPNNQSPYPDVPAGHTFAGVIGYCKTAGYISGYGDGTFKPANPLTGYAFAKMLLGAIGYKSNIEGFVDTGWTMNVARIGNVAGLFDRISFDGAAAVTRDEACQLALNTLKATMVHYGSTSTVISSSGEVLTVQGSQAQYTTSNNRDINANINRRVISATNNELTLEFGEEHFKDLRLEHDRYDPAYDIYGHPSNEWSYKKVTIGTFKLDADFTFTKQMAHLEDTPATKEKALGLRGYDTYSIDHRGGYVNWSTPGTGIDGYSSPFADATQIHINGWDARVRNTELYKQTDVPKDEKDLKGVWYTYDARDIDSTNKELAPSLSEICDLTDNGVTVEVYVCPVDADFITDVVVTRTQLMEVDRIASDFVELDTIGSDSNDPRKAGDLEEIAGYNDYSLFDEVVSVKDNNYDAYNVLKELKAGDEVAIIPYTSDDGKTWEVGEAYVPETVSGALTNVDIYNTKSKADGNAVAITVGGTTYPIAQWNKDMREITGTKIKATKKDVTLLLDKMGNALLAKDVGNANAWIIVGDYYQAAGTSGRVNWFVHGWTIKGDEVDLELGSIRGAAEKYAPGELVKYDVASGGNGEYELYKPNYNQLSVLKNGNKAPWVEPRGSVKDKVQTGEGIYTVSQFARQSGTGVVDYKYSIKSVNTLLPLEFYNTDSTKKENHDHVIGVHFDYNNATADPNRPVGTDAETAASTTNTTYCGEMNSATTFWTNAAPTYASNGSVLTGDYNEWYYRTAPYDGVKFIYVGFDSTTGEVEVINFVDGVQNVDYNELKQINRWWKNVGTNSGDFVASPAEAYVDKDGKVKAVVIKSDSAEANLKDLMVITDNRGANTSTKSTGAEAPTSGTYYTRQYVSGEDGFKEEKTGYFDKALSVGDVVTGSLKSDGIIRAKYFHAASYTNRNPDGIYAKGIAPLTTQEGKNSGYAFYVGAKNAGAGAQTLMLGYGVNGNNSYPLGEDNCEILTGKDVLGVNDNTPKEGLIKVDSTTQFIDLRDGRPGGIDEIGDLFDFDNDANIELKLIVNGNASSDGFRHAYAILILEAEAGPDNAKAPTVSILGKVGTQPSMKPATGDGKTAATAYKFTVDEGTEIKLSAIVSALTGVEKDAKWVETATGAVTNGKEITVTAPASLTFQVTNRDTTVANQVEATTTVYVEVGAAAATVTRTLTLANDLLVASVDASGNSTVGKPNTTVNVYVGVDSKTSSNVAMKMLPGGEVATATYQIPAGSVVTISSGAFTGSGATIPVTADDGTTVVNVALNNNSSNDTIVFTMPDVNLTLNMDTADQFVTADGGTNNTQVYTIKSVGGVVGTFKDGTTNAEQTLSAGGEITIEHAGTFTVTDPGTGNSVILSSGNKYAATAKAKDGVFSASDIDATANVTLYSANKVTTGTDVTINSTWVAAGSSAYVAVDETLTLGGGSGTGYIVVNDENTKAAAKFTGALKMTDNKDIWVYDAYEIKLDGVKATYGDANTEVTSGQLVAKTTDLTLAPNSATNAANEIAVEYDADEKIGLGVTSYTVAAAKEFRAYTKVDGENLVDDTTLSVMNKFGDPTGTAQTKSSSNKVFGVVAGTDIVVTENAANDGKKITVNGESTAKNIDGDGEIYGVTTGASAGSVAAKTTLRVGTAVVTLAQA